MQAPGEVAGQRPGVDAYPGSGHVTVGTQQVERGVASGMIHRDIKPANVISERGSGRMVLVDFAVVADRVAALVETSGQAFLGTLHYAAPEWVYRDPPGAADDAAVDVYGLGATFYEMMMGRRPFAEVTNAATLALLVRERTPELAAPAYDAELQALVRLMLAKTPGMRPSLAQIRRRLEGAETPPRPPSAARPAPHP